MRPVRVSEDTWAVNLPLPPTRRMPIIDAEQDYGLFVRKALELPVFPDKQTWATFDELISFEDQTKELSEATGKKVVFHQIPSAVFGEGVKTAGTPPHIALAIEEVFTSVGKFDGRSSFSFPL
ncbi:NmrA domain-containing protein [Mycena indigotica]|uniref:NmrA domain-containing protein n=1 Tax=Mycena indigotica TaxID=2126181 RepID=A0A8H6RY78_9AGAR|nr:NmrA domain-containing protein [Mycena indigotica]KAF7288780.1 NmrA domain-containing protein [Mycena indigotica]